MHGGTGKGRATGTWNIDGNHENLRVHPCAAVSIESALGLDVAPLATRDSVRVPNSRAALTPKHSNRLTTGSSSKHLTV